jgi:hypothetical protein
MVICVFAHTLLFLLPAAIIALPTPSPRNWDNEVFTGFTLIFNTWFALVFNLIQFIAQNRERRRQNNDPGALSLLGLTLQAITLTLVAMRWFLRLGWPNPEELSMRWPRFYEIVDMFQIWYVWGFIPFNYLIQACGHIILLVLYAQPIHLAVNIGQQGTGLNERMPLLG